VKRKLVLIAIPLIVLITLGASLYIITLNQAPTYEPELERYLQYINEAPGQYVVGSIVKASKPWNFNADMSRVSFGESVYYQTDNRFGKGPPDQDTLDLIPGDSHSGNLRPIPYPPEQVWCVYLEHKINAKDSVSSSDHARLVLIGLHQDLYNADIIIHEVPAGSKDKEIDVIGAFVGCERP
jgi:hypothetical protein